MKLSVIIVNYNVKNFLRQLLQSIEKSKTTFDYEVIVVDNNSVDGSVSMLEKYYSGKVKIITNKENLGFSKANNIGIKASIGEYVLLLNPDTIVVEDTFQKMVDFLNTQKDAGAVGVKMIDGEGKFLPESKRGLPTPEVALYKMIGLSRIFPRSQKFGRYHLGFLDENKTHEVDVLPGACMMIRRIILGEVGYLDEDYFMYGEDIDLSYQITRLGYKNYYFPETHIIHFKGESTKKGSLNYVRMFYHAMLIFFDKNLSNQQNQGLIWIIKSGIYLRALLAGFYRVVKDFTLLAADVVGVFTGLFLIKFFWQHYVKSGENITYFMEYVLVNFSLYCIIWLSSVYFTGGYDKPLKKRNVVKGVLWGTLIIAAIYGFLPMDYRFSRGMILAGAVWSVFILLFLRWLEYSLQGRQRQFWDDAESYVVVGNEKSAQKIYSFFQMSGLNRKYIGFVGKEISESDAYLGHIHQMKEVIQIHHPNEIIFASGLVNYSDIIKMMAQYNGLVKFKIAPEGIESIVGSHSKNTSGDFYTLEIGFHLAQPEHRRKKRLFDLLFSMFVLLISPLLLIFQKNKTGFFKNIFMVFARKKTWVGYHLPPSPDLPELLPGIIPFLGIKIETSLTKNLNITYAKEYGVYDDVETLIQNLRNLGN